MKLISCQCLILLNVLNTAPANNDLSTAVHGPLSPLASSILTSFSPAWEWCAQAKVINV